MVNKSLMKCLMSWVVATPVWAQDDAQELDCSVFENAATEVCLDLPDSDAPITNFAPVVAPLGSVAAVLGAALSAGGSSPSTTSTSTTGTQ